jgi:hypothetical protein
MAGRHRSRRRLGRWLVPCAGAVALWLADNDPFGAAGFGLLLAAGVLLGLFYPLLVILALEAPGALVPASWRAWYWKDSHERPHIRNWLRRAVYAADRYACCYCGSSAQIQLDHVKPWSVGGRTSFWNFCTLCAHHNRVKSNYWVHKSTRVTYTPWKGYGDSAQAAAILACELRHRRSLMRLVRAAIAL